ncbi:TPA: restriction endonuclease subunit S [Corynebacterium striatum]|nr:restriction endonuclease subunit S [Corynebacterium striatum]
MASTARHDWPMVRLGDVVEILNGFAFSSKDFGAEGEMPIIRIRDVVSGSTSTYYSGVWDKKYLIQPGEILVGMDGDFNYARWKSAPALLNQRVCRVSADEQRITDSYLFHALQFPLRDIWEKTAFVTVKHLSAKKLAEALIPLLPLNEQRRIAAILDEAGRLVSMQIKKVEGLEALKRVVVEEFLKERGDQEVELGSISEIQSGITKGRKVSKESATSIVPYLSVSNVKDGFLQLHPIKEINATNDEISRYQLQSGDIVLTEGGDPDKLGRGTVWNNEIPICIHQNHIFRVRILKDSTVMTPEVLAAILGSSRPKKHFLRSAKQTTGIASINKSQLSRTPIPSLTRDEVRALSLQIELLKSEQERVEIQRSSLEELRQSLSTRAFQGEL